MTEIYFHGEVSPNKKYTFVKKNIFVKHQITLILTPFIHMLFKVK